MSSKDTWNALKQPILERYSCFTCKFYEVEGNECTHPIGDDCYSTELGNEDNNWKWDGVSYDVNGKAR